MPMRDYGISKEDMQAYVNDGLSDVQIAVKTCFSDVWVKELRHRYGIRRKFGPEPSISKEMLQQLGHCMTDRAIATKLGVTYNTISRLRRQYGIPQRVRKHEAPDRQTLEQQSQTMTQRAIAKFYGVSYATVQLWQKGYKIKQAKVGRYSRVQGTEQAAS